MSLRAVLRVKSPLPNLMLYRDVVQAVKDGSSIEVSLKRTVNSQVIYESDPIDFRDSLLSLKALGKGLVAEYLFYEGSGTTLHDSSGNGNHGTIYGATWKKLSNGKNYLEFDGVDDYVEVPRSVTLEPAYITIEALVRNLRTVPYWGHMVHKDQLGTYTGYNLQIYSGKWSFGVGNGSAVAITYYDIPSKELTAWTHLVGTFDGNEVRLFVNSKLVDTKTLTGTLSYGTSNVIIGRSTHGNVEFFKGCIALVRIWSRALSEDEIKTLYQLAKLVVPELS